MRKTTATVAGALFLAAVLALTGCPNSATVQPEGGKTPSNTGETKTEKTEALTTSGTMEKPALQADGSTTLITTDSNGGRYTFTQSAPPAASIRSASSSGTWDYTNSTRIKQFAGSYSGDITSSGANSLSLTVEKAADPSGKLQEVTEPQSFDFEVSASGTFSATIPAVEIVVPVGPTEVELIKTATMENTFDYTYATESNIWSLHLYSDNTFKMYTDITVTTKEVDFSFGQTGIAFTGTYTGEPAKDGEIVLNIQKMSKDYWAFDYPAVYQAYKEGKKSVTFELAEEDLRPMQSSSLVVISGSTFNTLETVGASYIPNEDGSTTFQVNVEGTDADKFQLTYRIVEGSNSSGTEQTGSFNTPIAIADATDDAKVDVTLFWDNTATPNDSSDGISLGKTVKLKPGHNAQIDMKVRKISVPFKVEGNQSQYEDIYVYTNTSSRAIAVPASSPSIDFYILDDSISIPAYTLYAKNRTSSSAYGYSISDSVPVILDKENPPTSPVTIRLYDKLAEGSKITIAAYPSDTTFTEEEKKQFRFIREDNGNIIFYIPAGVGTDGDFITCSSMCDRYGSSSVECSRSDFEHLLQATYSPIEHLYDQAYDNYQYQFTGLIENMQDVVWFLENRKGLTVYGKELIGLQ